MALLVAFTFIGIACASDLWKVDIDRSPAPSPEDGPPFSANAIRDPRLLPYQITGIAGSYVCVILFIGILLTTVGRRSRKRAQELANGEKSTEMVRPFGVMFDPSPISPQSSKTWYSPRRLKGKRSAAGSIKSMGSVISPGAESTTSFDASVVQADRQKRANEMERLYAAVMAQDDRRAPPEYSRGPLHVDVSPHLGHLQDGTPRSPVRAIYPPDQMPPLPTSPLSPVHLGHRRIASDNDSVASKRLRKSVKHLKISAPIMRVDNDDDARTPLSPRVYTNPGVPPDLPTSRTAETYDSTYYAPTTPGTAQSYSWEDRERELEDVDEIRTVARPAKTLSKSSQINYSQPLRINTNKSNAPVASVDNVLPFRQLHWNSPSSPYYPYQGQGPFSAGPTKTTFVESRRDRFGVGTPKTGMATPYSAYMPFTPVTPVVANISTRAERRQRERDERALEGAIVEEDQVPDDAELWDEGY